jgi:hypothetical protein
VLLVFVFFSWVSTAQHTAQQHKKKKKKKTKKKKKKKKKKPTLNPAGPSGSQKRLHTTPVRVKTMLQYTAGTVASPIPARRAHAAPVSRKYAPSRIDTLLRASTAGITATITRQTPEGLQRKLP